MLYSVEKSSFFYCFCVVFICLLALAPGKYWNSRQMPKPMHALIWSTSEDTYEEARVSCFTYHIEVGFCLFYVFTLVRCWLVIGKTHWQINSKHGKIWQNNVSVCCRETLWPFSTFWAGWSSFVSCIDVTIYLNWRRSTSDHWTNKHSFITYSLCNRCRLNISSPAPNIHTNKCIWKVMSTTGIFLQ